VSRSMWANEKTPFTFSPLAAHDRQKDIGRGAAVRVGLRRVDWIRLFVDSDQARVGAEAVGVGFRLPVTCPISLAAAEDLIASGIPSVTCRLGAGV
jgi:hypothetical protein